MAQAEGAGERSADAIRWTSPSSGRFFRAPRRRFRSVPPAGRAPGTPPGTTQAASVPASPAVPMSSRRVRASPRHSVDSMSGRKRTLTFSDREKEPSQGAEDRASRRLSLSPCGFRLRIRITPRQCPVRPRRQASAPILLSASFRPLSLSMLSVMGAYFSPFLCSFSNLYRR